MNRNMWVVVTGPGKNRGRVGMADRAAYFGINGKGRLAVQFGSSGPVRIYNKTSLTPVHYIVDQVQQMTGAPYNMTRDG